MTPPADSSHAASTIIEADTTLGSSHTKLVLLCRWRGARTSDDCHHHRQQEAAAPALVPREQGILFLRWVVIAPSRFDGIATDNRATAACGRLPHTMYRHRRQSSTPSSLVYWWHASGHNAFYCQQRWSSWTTTLAVNSYPSRISASQLRTILASHHHALRHYGMDSWLHRISFRELTNRYTTYRDPPRVSWPQPPPPPPLQLAYSRGQQPEGNQQTISSETLGRSPKLAQSTVLCQNRNISTKRYPTPWNSFYIRYHLSSSISCNSFVLAIV
jgi:hypothetical protein